MLYNDKHFSLNHVFFCRTLTYYAMQIKYEKENSKILNLLFYFTKINHMNENIFLNEIYNGKIGHLLAFRKHSEYL